MDSVYNTVPTVSTVSIGVQNTECTDNTVNDTLASHSRKPHPPRKGQPGGKTKVGPLPIYPPPLALCFQIVGHVHTHTPPDRLAWNIHTTWTTLPFYPSGVHEHHLWPLVGWVLFGMVRHWPWFLGWSQAVPCLGRCEGADRWSCQFFRSIAQRVSRREECLWRHSFGLMLIDTFQNFEKWLIFLTLILYGIVTK